MDLVRKTIAAGCSLLFDEEADIAMSRWLIADADKGRCCEREFFSKRECK